MATNMVTLMVYKSKRKNAAILKYINIFALQSKDNRISDVRILEQMVSTVATIASINQNTSVNMGSYETIYRPFHVNSVNGEYEAYKEIRHYNPRRSYDTFESIIDEVYRLYMLLYPYSYLDISTVYQDSSIKYYINQFYS